MRLYLAPLFWLTFSVLALASDVYMASSRFQSRLSADRLAAVQKGYSRRLITFWVVVAALFFAYAVMSSVISGEATWWLWSLAAAAQLATLPVRRFAAVKVGVVEFRPDVQTQRRHRRAM